MQRLELNGDLLRVGDGNRDLHRVALVVHAPLVPFLLDGQVDCLGRMRVDEGLVVFLARFRAAIASNFGLLPLVFIRFAVAVFLWQVGQRLRP